MIRIRIRHETILRLGSVLGSLRTATVLIGKKPKGTSISVKAENSILDRLVEAQRILTDLPISEKILTSLGEMISYLTKKYPDHPKNLVHAVLGPGWYLNQKDAEDLKESIGRWREDISNSLATYSQLPFPSKGTLIELNLLLGGLEFFLDNKTLTKLPDYVISDLRQTIECILAGLPTAGTMISHRAAEGVIRQYYKSKTNEEPTGKLYSIIEELISRKDTDKPLAGYLHFIRSKRNEAGHPPKIFSQRECEEAFNQVIQLIREIHKV